MNAQPLVEPTAENGGPSSRCPGRSRASRVQEPSIESPFDDLARLAALVCGTESARVDLLGEGGTRTIGAYGLDGIGRGDDRFGFRAAAAIHDPDRIAIGSVLVLDQRSRPEGLTDEQRDGLQRLGRQATALIEGRHAGAYRDAFRHAAVDLVLIDVHDGGGFTYRDLNDAHSAHTGLHPETFIGRSPEEALLKGTAEFALAKYRECLRTGTVVAYEQVGRFPLGERVRRSVVAPLRDPAGKIDRLLLTSIDLTELHATQAQLRQSQKMEAMGQLAGGLAHDFNNLLSAITANLELLAGKLTEPAQRKRVETALRTAARGGSLIEQLLAFARPRQGVIAGIDPNAAIDAMLDLLRRSLGSAIEIETDLQPDLWPIAAEAAQLEQAVLNLAINARDAMPDGGAITVRTRNLPAGDPELAPDVPAGDYVVVSVADQGVGMPPDVVERATEPFFTTKPPGKGSGLGLSQVYGFARQFGGAVRIDSTVGRGTTVTLVLPRGTDADTDHDASPSVPPP